MREIKFRAWVPEAESFIFTNDLTGILDNQTILLWGCGDWSKHKVECVQQFTGLTDKNGKEIYEGDILRYPNGVEQIIKYVDSEASFRGFHKIPLSYPYTGSFLDQDICKQSEVIGNIFEDSHLLEEQNG